MGEALDEAGSAVAHADDGDVDRLGIMQAHQAAVSGCRTKQFAGSEGKERFAAKRDEEVRIMRLVSDNTPLLDDAATPIPHPRCAFFRRSLPEPIELRLRPSFIRPFACPK
jgi:hypothetical protein